MTTASAEKKHPEKTITEILAERPKALIKLQLTLEEFAERVTVEYDDRCRWHSWRVEGDQSLWFWIYDHIIHDKENHPKISDREAVECAYNRLKAIQERGGQVNIHSVYVQDVEQINLIEPKLPIQASVNIVKDRVDGLYRFSTSFFIGLGGESSAPWFGEKVQITETKEQAILRGARYILERLTESWQAKDEPGDYNPNINKIKKYIENLEGQIRQPSLFG
jgi:hypothetical protein